MYVAQELGVTIFMVFFVVLNGLGTNLAFKGVFGIICLGGALGIEFMMIVKRVCFGSTKSGKKSKKVRRLLRIKRRGD